jgi:phenylpropionate dioxygenase-like ring-hydroxylating dioxygenase large terminal subunit
MNEPASVCPLVPDEELALLGTDPIPAGPYYRPDYFEIEREAVFRRSWLHVGHVCEFSEPGRYRVVELEVLEASILIVRGQDGRLRAFHNVCVHRGTQLVEEPRGTAASFTCRYHAWTYGNDGALRGAPEMHRFFVDKADCRLKEVALDVCGGLVFVSLDREPRQTLAEFLGPLAQQLEGRPNARATSFAEYVYEIDANWKLTIDNFQEHYHIRFIHGRSIGSTTLTEENPFGYPTEFRFHGPHRTQRMAYNPAFAPEPVQGQALGILFGAAARDGFGADPDADLYFNLFPNSFLLGTATQNFIHTIWPISARRSRGVIRVFWIGEDESASQRFAREFAVASLIDVHSEDRAVIEAGQRGLNSGALDHIHFQAQEVACRHFFNTVDAAVQAYRAEAAAA